MAFVSELRTMFEQLPTMNTCSRSYTHLLGLGSVS